MEGQLQREARAGGSQLLRRTLQANGLFSGLSGLLLLLAASPVAQLLVPPAPLPDAALILRGIGLGLLLYAGFLFYTAGQEPLNRTFAWEAVILDVLWVAGSALLLFSGWAPFSTEGKWAVALVADVVAVFAILQVIGIRRLDAE